jgi:RNA polymerase sigma-70 factor (ECF subfamily)
MVVDVDDVLAERFTEHRGHLLGVAYRLTSTMADAEDAVQEAWLRLAGLSSAARADIRDLRAWLTTVVGRICLDRLRSAAVTRESYVGPWLPEPVVTPLPGQVGEDPVDAVVRDEGVRLAALIVLDRLSPEQRVAFVLHDAFGLPFAEIAEALGCSADTARQHASRGRRAVADADPPARIELAEQQELLGRFLTALSSGDVHAVVELLHPDVVLIGDSDGKARTARNRIDGPDKVARFLLGLMQRYGGDRATGNIQLALVNGDLGVVFADLPADGEHLAMDRRVSSFTVRDGRLATLYDIVNPDKLTRLAVPQSD